MSPIPQRFAIPTGEDQFEELCLQLLQLYWSRPGLERFGKRGERQFGIDILDIGGQLPIYAAQCKLREEHKTLPPSEIEAEVSKAKHFSPALGKYAILTTAKVSALAQRKVREINQSHRAGGLFVVELITWERLCSLLQQYSDVQERFYGEIAPGKAEKIESRLLAIKGGIDSLTSRIEGDGIDSEINEARDCIVKKDFQFATFLLNRLQNKSGERFTTRQRFRVLSNLGAAALGMRKAEVAARYFLQARPLQPGDELAEINEVHAYFLIGDVGTSHSKASELRSKYPHSARLATLWLLTAPKDYPLSTLESGVDAVLKSDPEVCVSLARRALMVLAFEKADQYAADAARVAPNWSQPHLVIATTKLGQTLRSQLGFHAQEAGPTNSLLEAETECSKSLDLARAEKDAETQKEALAHRVEIRLLLKRTDQAVSDAEEAAEIDSEDPKVMLVLAQVRQAVGRVDDAISILTKAYELEPRADIAFTLAKTLSSRGRAEDLDHANSVLLSIDLRQVPSSLRPVIAASVVQSLASKPQFAKAESYLDSVASSLEPIVPKILRGYIAHHQQRQEEAEKFALEAKAGLGKDVEMPAKQLLARLLMLIGRPGDALPIWLELFDSAREAFDPGNLLDCAAKLRRDSLVIDVCDRLHTRGVNTWQLLEFELSYLEKYKIDAAIERLRSFLAADPHHKMARLRLSMIGLRLNRPELVSAELDDLPPIAELPARYAVAAVQVLRYGGKPNVALDFAYQYLRENFQEIEAHKALIVSMTPGLCAPELSPSLDAVGSGAAVCYQEEFAGSSPTWVVLEDTSDPNSDFEEITPSSPRAVELLGKKVNDVITIAKGHHQDRLARIIAIVPKYVRRFQDSMGEMQVRFGAASTVESIRIEPPAADDPQGGLGAIFSSVEKRAAIVAQAHETYRTQPVSLHVLGEAFGQSTYEALVNVAREEGLAVRCSAGSAEERAQALQALEVAKAVVVDISALATLRLLGLEAALRTKKFHFIISERTWVLLQERLFYSRVFSAPGGTLAYLKGQHVMFESSQEDKDQRIHREREFIKLVDETTERRCGPELAAIEPEKRNLLEKLLGPYGAESSVLASDPSHVLWTDDLIHAQASAQEFGTRRVWTQLVLGSLAEAGLISTEEFCEATARLVGMEYVSTTFDGLSMLAGLRLSEWSLDRNPAAQFLKVFSDKEADLQGLSRVLVGFVAHLYREPTTPETRCAVLRSFLGCLGQTAQGMMILQSVRQLSPQLFGINHVGRVQFEQCFDAWFRGRDRPLIVLPG